MSPDEELRRQRAATRQSWPVRRHRLGEEPGDDLSATTTPEQRLAMMWELAVQAWTLTGRDLPSYSRESMPGKVLRPGR